MKRLVLLVVGVLLIALGLIWIFQGIGVLGGSFMTGQKLWFLIGIGVTLLGVISIVATVRRPRSKTG